MKKKNLFSRLVLSGLLVNSVIQGAPSWWSSRQVVNSNLSGDDFAIINQGQLKALAKKAYDELESKYANYGGAGSELDLLIQSWTTSLESDDFAAVTIGQVKKLSGKYYERLLSVGAISELPAWLNSVNGDDDYSAANIGQVKHAFSFEIPMVMPMTPTGSPNGEGSSGNIQPTTSDNDGILDEDETRFGLNPNASDDANSSSSQGFLPDELGRLMQVLRVTPHAYGLDNEANVLSVNN
jgi:hypothetical protein